jgi:hypothetical protein
LIVEELLNLAEDELKKREAIDVRVGLSYTGVLLDDQSLGLAYSFREEATECCEVVDKAGELGGNSWELAKLALTPHAVDASVGIATLNAVFNRDIRGEEGDILDFLDLKKSDKVGMVGNFKPVIERMGEDIPELYIFERRPQEEEDIYPDWAAEQLLPRANVAIITGTALVNKTIDHLLELSKNAREIAILGPSTPMAPEVFKKRGVTLLSGMVVKDIEKALGIISQGGGTRKLKNVSRKVTLVLK